jgi:hypothetical protein
LLLLAQESGQEKPSSTAVEDLLWKKLDAGVSATRSRVRWRDGVAIVDLTDERAILKNADPVFPTASSIKIAILLHCAKCPAARPC